MQLDMLIATGLTAQQATAYSYLIESGSVRPPDMVVKLGITRTNAYKLLDKLVELKLANKSEAGNKSIYTATNPVALAAYAGSFRAEATAREEAVRNVMQELLTQYQSHSDQPLTEVFSGQQAVAKAYRQQIALGEDISFVHTYADVTQMGFDVMHEIRSAPAHYGNKRQGLMFPNKGKEAHINYAGHERSNLDATFGDTAYYDSPVEWSVTRSSLLIVMYSGEPQAIFIADQLVARAFLQLFRLLQSLLRQQSVHQALAHQ